MESVNNSEFFGEFARLVADSLIPISRTYDFLLLTTTSHSLIQSLFEDFECKLYGTLLYFANIIFNCNLK